MKKTFLAFASLLVVLGFVGYSLSYSEANVTSPLELKIEDSARALIGVRTSAFTATEQKKTDSVLATPTNAAEAPAESTPDENVVVESTPIQEPQAIATNTNATPLPTNAGIKGVLLVSNNMSTPFTIDRLLLNANGIACATSYDKCVYAGQSILIEVAFEGDPSAVWTLTGELFGSFEGGTARIGIDLAIPAVELILPPEADAKDASAQP